jgi:hypothetical protein
MSCPGRSIYKRVLGFDSGRLFNIDRFITLLHLTKYIDRNAVITLLRNGR